MTEAFSVTRLAAAKRGRFERPRNGPVVTITSDRKAWAVTLRLAGARTRSTARRPWQQT